MEQITGTVARVSKNGFQLSEREGWLNVSKYAEGVALPSVGAVVLAELDGKGFVRRIEQAGSVAATNVSRHASARSSAGSDARQTAITRLACLNTATAILGGGPGSAIDAAEVVKLAGRLEAWVIRAG